MRIAYLLLVLIFSLHSFSFQTSQNEYVLKNEDEKTSLNKKPPFLEIETPWADSIIAQMSLDEKIGQLFNMAAYSNKGDAHTAEILQQIEKYHIGGLTFFQGSPHRQAELTNLFQDSSKIPLMISFDGEWGLSMRIDSTVKYPWAMTLGAIAEDSLIYEMGLQMAEQFRRIGVHVNFGPSVDVNNNSMNPIINARSFGEDPQKVAQKGVAYMKGLQDGNVLACAKHFPGHGDTDADSHYSLPLIAHNRARMDSVELFPFKTLFKEGVGSVMTAHLNLPEFTKGENIPSSLSTEIVDTLLKQELGFEGLVFTDGLNMAGVRNYSKNVNTELQALKAGNDVLLIPQNIEKAFEAIKTALDSGEITEERITRSAYKILKAKEWLNIHQEHKVVLENLYEDLNKDSYNYLNRVLVEKSITVLRNKKQTIPLRQLEGKRIVSVAFAQNGVSYQPYQKALNRYAKVDTMHFSELPVMKQKALMDTLLTYDHVIVSLHISNAHPWVKYAIDNEYKNFLNILRLKKDIVIDVFANAYSLQGFLAAEHAAAVILSYQNSEMAQDLSAQLIFGGIQAGGELPVSVSPQLKAGYGLLSDFPIRLKYTMPEELGLASKDFAKIDKIVEDGIVQKAYPGAQIYIAKSNKVIYHKSFGKTTYEGNQKVELTDLYDLASITKIASTLLTVMELDGKGKLSLDDPLGKHLKIVKGTPYENLSLRSILAHQAGLVAWVPFYKNTLHHGMPRFDLYAHEKTGNYSIKVADSLYLLQSYRDSIFERILYKTKVSDKKEYRYSDIGFYLLKEMVEQINRQSIDQYNQQHFYEPLGMSRTSFNPLNEGRFTKSEIAPTENDQYFRHQLVHGYVHDQGAAMLGGIGGHSGLFSNANDLGKLLQMFLQYGEYAERSYLESSVIKEYIKCQFCSDSTLKKEDNRRGAGFDKPAFHGTTGPTCDCVSFHSYGHSGFTGTYAWVDPDEELVYIFLSNRVYPSAEMNKLAKIGTRTKIQKALYEAIESSRKLSKEVTHL